jgi:NADPH:quinone reductase-like Zn-dependent oxidoreductase
MRAVVYDGYGPPHVQRIEEVERPVPKKDEVLVKIHATTVNRSDVHTREANRGSGLAIMLISRLLSGFLRPRQRILGSEFAGEVEAVGAAVSEFAVGDHVFGSSGLGFGAHAEFMCMRESGRIAHMPAGMSFEEAAPVCDGALNALTCLKQADLRKGRRILIYGASGAIGTAGVQLARYFSADVTAVCSTKNLELVRSLGADTVIDYTQEDFTKNGQTYDVLFLKELIEAGKYRAVIDRCYPLEDVVEATRYVETQQKTGNVVLTVNDGRAK